MYKDLRGFLRDFTTSRLAWLLMLANAVLLFLCYYERGIVFNEQGHFYVDNPLFLIHSFLNLPAILIAGLIFFAIENVYPLTSNNQLNTYLFVLTAVFFSFIQWFIIGYLFEKAIQGVRNKG